MSETSDTMLKRLTMRSWRRGTKEMDLILGPFADARLATMGSAELELYDRLLLQNDQDLYPWITGFGSPAADVPEELAGLIAEIGRFARARLSPQG